VLPFLTQKKHEPMRTQYKEELGGIGTLLNLQDLIRVGARQMLAVAFEAEIAAYMEQNQQIKTADGKAAMVRKMATIRCA